MSDDTYRAADAEIVRRLIAFCEGFVAATESDPDEVMMNVPGPDDQPLAVSLAETLVTARIAVQRLTSAGTA